MYNTYGYFGNKYFHSKLAKILGCTREYLHANPEVDFNNIKEKKYFYMINTLTNCIEKVGK